MSTAWSATGSTTGFARASRDTRALLPDSDYLPAHLMLGGDAVRTVGGIKAARAVGAEPGEMSASQPMSMLPDLRRRWAIGSNRKEVQCFFSLA